MWQKFRSKLKKLRDKGPVRAQPVHECEFRLEAVAENGHVVEMCDVCFKRRVFVVHRDESVTQHVFSKVEWEVQGGKILSKGVRRVRRDPEGAGEPSSEGSERKASTRLRKLALRKGRRDTEVE